MSRLMNGASIYYSPNSLIDTLLSSLGPMVTIVMRMSSLNSCVNPWIYLTFNQKLYKALKKLFLCSGGDSESHRYSGDVRSC